MNNSGSCISAAPILIRLFIHNLEESFQMPQYLANQFSITFITSQQFSIAISILTLFVLLIVFLYQLNILPSIYWIIF
ncbi:HXXEE domain-containing protein, partial [Bacillus sp. D-CC]